jgi:penicillin-binding protein 1A
MARRKDSFRRRHPTLVRAVLLLFTFGMALGAGLAFGAWTLVCRGGQCPPVESLNDYTPRQTSKLYAVDGRFIAELGLERRTLITLDEIPDTVLQAFIITEDKRFYRHAGIDWYRVFGAFARNVAARRWQEGFSTITMQLARNVFPERISREKTLVRKIKEAKVSREIESKFDKGKILELYLNQINRLAEILREICPGPQHRRGGDVGGAAEGSRAVQSKTSSRARDSAAQYGHRADAAQRCHK